MTLRSRELGAIAQTQLAAWRDYAAKWYWRMESRDTQLGHRLGAGIEQFHLVCAACDTSMALVVSEGFGYLMNTELLLDAVTRHLRNQHRGIEANVYGRQDAQTDSDSRGYSDSNGPGPDLG